MHLAGVSGPIASPPVLAPSSRRTARRGVAAVAVAAIALVALAGCSTPAPANDDIVDALVSSGLPEDVATCAADALTDTLTDDQLAELTERGGGGAPTDDPARTDDTADQLRDAMSRCRTLYDASTTTTTAPAGSTTTSVAPDDGGAGGGAAGDGASIDSTPTTAP